MNENTLFKELYRFFLRVHRDKVFLEEANYVFDNRIFNTGLHVDDFCNNKTRRIYIRALLFTIKKYFNISPIHMFKCDDRACLCNMSLKYNLLYNFKDLEILDRNLCIICLGPMKTVTTPTGEVSYCEDSYESECREYRVVGSYQTFLKDVYPIFRLLCRDMVLEGITYD